MKKIISKKTIQKLINLKLNEHYQKKLIKEQPNPPSNSLNKIKLNSFNKLFNDEIETIRKSRNEKNNQTTPTALNTQQKTQTNLEQSPQIEKSQTNFPKKVLSIIKLQQNLTNLNDYQNIINSIFSPEKNDNIKYYEQLPSGDKKEIDFTNFNNIFIRPKTAISINPISPIVSINNLELESDDQKALKIATQDLLKDKNFIAQCLFDFFKKQITSQYYIILPINYIKHKAFYEIIKKNNYQTNIDLNDVLIQIENDANENNFKFIRNENNQEISKEEYNNLQNYTITPPIQTKSTKPKKETTTSEKQTKTAQVEKKSKEDLQNDIDSLSDESKLYLSVIFLSNFKKTKDINFSVSDEVKTAKYLINSMENKKDFITDVISLKLDSTKTYMIQINGNNYELKQENFINLIKDIKNSKIEITD